MTALAPRQDGPPARLRGPGRPRAVPGAPRVSRSLPARYPPVWPAEMRADVAAAFLDFATTGELFKAILRKEAPRPTASRLRVGRRVPVWALESLRAFVAHRHQIAHDASPDHESVEDLV